VAQRDMQVDLALTVLEFQGVDPPEGVADVWAGTIAARQSISDLWMQVARENVAGRRVNLRFLEVDTVAYLLLAEARAFTPGAGGTVRAGGVIQPARDFEQAMALRRDSWVAVVESGDEEAAACVAMMLSLQMIYIGESDLDDEAVDEIDAKAPELIPSMVTALNTWTKSHSAPPAGSVGRAVIPGISSKRPKRSSVSTWYMLLPVSFA